MKLRRWIDVLGQDFRFSTRTLWRHRSYATVALLMLGLGIGANAVVFSALDAVLLRPLPYMDGDRIVLLKRADNSSSRKDTRLSVAEVADFRNRVHSFESLAEYHAMRFDLLTKGEPMRVQAGVVSSDFFAVMGIKPMLGRLFTDHDEQSGAEPVVLLSHRFWQARGGDPDILGQTLEMNKRIHLIIGVLPPLPLYPDENDIYITTSACPFRSEPQVISARDLRGYLAFGRLRRGVDLSLARVEAATVAAQVTREHPDTYSSRQDFETSLTLLREELVQGARPTLFILLGTAGLVLLTVCANLANLSFARLLKRQEELALRSALGAGRRRLGCQLLAESAILAFAGGVLGFLFALAAKRLIVALILHFTPRAGEIEIDNRVLIFALLAAMFAEVSIGLLLVLRLPSLGLHEVRTRAMIVGSRRQGILVGVQLAASLVLLIGAGLMLRSLYRLQGVDPGFDPRHVLTVGIDLDFARYAESGSMLSFQEELLRRVRAQPGVVSAAFASTFPLNQGGPPTLALSIEGRLQQSDKPTLQVNYRAVSPKYFETLRVSFVEGRDFTEGDVARALPVVLVSRSMAQHFWQQESPIGARVSLDGGQTWRTVVGVVGDARQYGLDRDATDEVYVPVAQQPFLNGSLLVRTTGDPIPLTAAVRKAVRVIDPHQPLSRVTTLEDLRGESLATPQLTSTLLAVFAGVVLVVAATGLAALVTFWVNQRTHEIGIRMAVGAQGGDVLRLVLRQVAVLLLWAVPLGLAGALVLTRFAAGLLFEILPTDLPTYFAVSSFLTIVVGLACVVPAWQAMTIDPVVALRSK
jgi:predicted permease